MGNFVAVLLLVAQTSAPVPSLALDALPLAAREALSRAADDAAAHPDSPAAVGALARTLHAWAQWDAAHQAYERLEQLDPATFEWRYLDAVVLQRLARHDDAVAELRTALTLSPAYLPARVKFAEALLDAGNLDESQRVFTALVTEAAAEPVAQVGLGRIAAAQRRHDAAVAHLERAVALFPELGAAYYTLARSYRALGRLDDARRAMARHEQYGPRWPALEDDLLERVVALKDDPHAAVQRGMKRAEIGDLEGAIAAHEAALARSPSLADAHANLISLYGRTGNWGKAEEHYRSLVALGVNLDEAHYDYGVLRGLQEQWDAAADAYRQALAVNPHHPRAHNNLGQILERGRKWEEAAAEYRRAVESEPGFRLARFNLGRMLIALGRPLEAVTELEKTVEPRDAEAPRYIFGLSAAHVRAGHREEGIKWGMDAQRLAREFGQHDLAAAIERDLSSLR